MEEINPNIPEETAPVSRLTDTEVFTRIWIAPRQVFRFIHHYRYDRFYILLLILGGISRALDRAETQNMGDHSTLTEIIAMCVIGGGIFGWIWLYVYAALLSWTGDWLKGRGDTTTIVRMLAYVALPSAISLVLLLPEIAVYGGAIFKSNADTTSAGLVGNIIYYGAILCEFILGVYSIIFLVVAVAEVQGFSIGKAILNIFLPVFVLIIPILLIVLLVKSF